MKSLIDPRTEYAMKDEAKKARYTLGNNGYVKVLDSRSDKPSTTSRMNALLYPKSTVSLGANHKFAVSLMSRAESWKTIGSGLARRRDAYRMLHFLSIHPLFPPSCKVLLL